MEKLCSEHSGIKTKINQLCKSDDSQWKEINSMKNRMIVILTGIILTLTGVVVNLAILLAKVP